MVSAWHVLTCNAIDIGGVVSLDGMAGGCCSRWVTLAVSDTGKRWWQSMLVGDEKVEHADVITLSDISLSLIDFCSSL